MNKVFMPAEILLPEGVPMGKWATLACDQFTSEPEYWHKAEAEVGDAPSTLRIILPEVYLEEPDVAQRIARIHAAMETYTHSVLTKKVPGFVYIRRTLGEGIVREGLVGCVDLEEYSYQPGAACRIRPSENTIVERIPPRLAVRRGAPLESPHILMLVDDAAQTVIEPLAAKTGEMPLLYDTPLMLGGGHIQGWAVTGTAQIAAIQAALAALEEPAAFATRYGTAEGTPFPLAVGDGNHSLATAKAWWEEVKQTLPQGEQAAHPARYCLVELENVQSPAIEIEPIHRVLFGVQPAHVAAAAQAFAAKHGFTLVKKQDKTFENSSINPDINGKQDKNNENTQYFVTVAGTSTQAWQAQGAAYPLAVGTLEAFLSDYLAQNPAARVDYVHGEGSVKTLAQQEGTVGIILPPLQKGDLFLGVAQGGVLPKKTFSMGHATEKRYYLECRRIAK